MAEIPPGPTDKFIKDPTKNPINDFLRDDIHSIQPASGFYGSAWPSKGAVPQGFSSAGWTTQARGYQQQTFLGASIRSFTMNGGFGSSSSTLSVELVDDEYNDSDNTPQGFGDDVYHSGKGDHFVPPIAGAPVFFKFGKNFASVEQAYLQTYDDLYFPWKTKPTKFPLNGGNYDINKFTSLPNHHYVDLETNIIYNYNNIVNDSSPNPINVRGRDHLVFGGLLQSYIENRSEAGNPLYSVQVVDPREILSNCVLILNNYAGSTFNNYNIFNIYGFLEHDLTTPALNELSNNYSSSGILTRILNGDGSVMFSGVNPRTQQIDQTGYGLDSYFDANRINQNNVSSDFYPPRFPITGCGFSRRSAQGIPYYRVIQALQAMYQFNGKIPDEYNKNNYGGFINFRGFNYIVDFRGLPKLPNFYYLDYDQMTLLDLALEICEATSRELFVTLLPVIDHEACRVQYQWNNGAIVRNKPKELIAGIIRLDAIDRSKQPDHGVIQEFIGNLANSGIYVTNQDVGFEVSNVVTDKFIVGAQEVDMYYFSNNADRDDLEIKLEKLGQSNLADKLIGDQWKLETSLTQQILPYYGKLGENAVTIPKGFGAYQQILLDSSNLNANGVGNYYVATEMELRCALISYERWKAFLISYNDIYLESVELDDVAESAALSATPLVAGWPTDINLSNNYAVTVPRCVFISDNEDNPYGSDGLPKNACSPPYGYPLYYKRATKVGIPEAGLTDISYRYTTIITNLAKVKNATNTQEFKTILNSEWAKIREDLNDPNNVLINNIYDHIIRVINTAGPTAQLADLIGLFEDRVEGVSKSLTTLPRLAKQATENSLKIYNFIKSIADECLGKKFLVKLPKYPNIYYNKEIIGGEGDIAEYYEAPFGFRPRPAVSGSDIGYLFSQDFQDLIDDSKNNIKIGPPVKFAQNVFSGSNNMIRKFLSPDDQSQTILNNYTGALCGNYNPVLDQYEFNYEPMNQGGFFDFDLLSNLFPASKLALLRNGEQVGGGNGVNGAGSFKSMPTGVQQGLIPQDLTNFINENGRISAYVRFDNSQFLALDHISKDTLTQQIVNTDNMIPDIAETLDNLSADLNGFHSFPNTKDEERKKIDNNNKDTKQIAFIKCQVDEKLYMPPLSKIRSTFVQGREIKDIGKFPKPRKITNASGELVDAVPYYVAHYVPNVAVSGTPDKSFSTEVLDFLRHYDNNKEVDIDQKNNKLFASSGTIDTSLRRLDLDHVYVLITLPSRVVPTKDARFKDGPFQNLNAESLKHFLTMDTIKQLEGFDKPAVKFNPTKASKNEKSNLLELFKDKIDADVQLNAVALQNKALRGLSFAFPQQVNLIMPSPVYPDLVALPLLSKERCYGPWISSAIGSGQAFLYSDLGGKIEFIKDENLSPWNYGGYSAMNEAGKLQAEFSNSLLLFSERGGFVVPDLPSGASLGKALLNNGPLVTNISVDVSENGLKTTYQLDLYTASFGKLQKQKQDELSRMARERQKLRDEKNALIRKSLGKSQSNTNYQKIYDDLNSKLAGAESMFSRITELQNKALVPTETVATVIKKENSIWDAKNSQDAKQTQYGVEVAMQSLDSIGIAAQNFPDQMAAAKTFYNSAASSLSKAQSPACMDLYHPNMSYKYAPFLQAKHGLYRLDETQEIPDSDLTLYEE